MQPATSDGPARNESWLAQRLHILEYREGAAKEEDAPNREGFVGPTENSTPPSQDDRDFVHSD